MLISVLGDVRSSQTNLDSLEEFLDLYSVRETCGMLLQIYIEKENFYVFSRKVIDSINAVKGRE